MFDPLEAYPKLFRFGLGCQKFFPEKEKKLLHSTGINLALTLQGCFANERRTWNGAFIGFFNCEAESGPHKSKKEKA